MTGHISAPVRRILKGHSDRAFIHAVDDAGLEYKIEVPLAAVQDVGPGQRHVLVLSWSLQQVPAEVGAVNAQPSPPSPIRAAAPLERRRSGVHGVHGPALQLDAQQLRARLSRAHHA
ncbi:hypothetical protein OV079_02490 [Nannocystis pusilla]|uniref:Uncharacterized protein n=1 Tax=Nannocystis pusilla TaxID=889268 RepID=A0A9X3IVH2_9BACT|nr:hypothetical protein [Nannocystis pusilla]MCY1004454.1 hypothetical protein [Nannocystis pusilla]